MTGEKPGQAGWHGSSETGAQVPARQNSPVPLAVFAHRHMRMRNLAASSDEKPLRVESSNSGRFRAWMNRSHPEGEQLLLCISTVRPALADQDKTETALRKTPKGRQTERTHREDHGNLAGSVKNFRAPAMLKTAPLDCEIKCNLREERRDPWPRANAPSQAVADLEPVVKTRTTFAGVS